MVSSSKHFDDITEATNAFRCLLDQNLKEQDYQEFLENNTKLIPLEFNQNHGVHLDLVLRKLSLGDFVTDFFYLSKSSASWHCVLVELEKPGSKYFVDNSSIKFHKDFNDAKNQIQTWRMWFSNPSNFNGFVNGTIRLLHRPPLTSNPFKIKYVLVMGRRSELEGNHNRRAMISSCEADDFRIMSYDSLLDNLAYKRELYIGARKNDRIDVLSNFFAGESLLGHLEPAQIRITPQLRTAALAQRASWFHLGKELNKYLLDERLPLIQDL